MMPEVAQAKVITAKDPAEMKTAGEAIELTMGPKRLRKTTQLRHLIFNPTTDFILEAHNGLTAQIVEEAGFKGIWASGLTISASMGVRDNNEASWTQILEVLEFMSDATRIPILLDGDTGYGNFNNVRRLIKKLEQRGIAGVCLEDKLFPKTNSFIASEQQPLASIEEFCGKIKAAKDSQTDLDFVVVARIEAFIAGWGLSEALKRADAYCRAGADALLVHSKRTTANEIITFMREWGNTCPIIIVPTKYYATPTEVFKELGINLVIWGNHMLRASIAAMQKTAKTIFKEQSLIKIEDKIASVNEVFRLQGDGELREAEKRYLPITKTAKAVVLAASRGTELGELTASIPKTMVPINGVPILQKQVDLWREAGIRDITVVTGYGEKFVKKIEGIKTISNPRYDSTFELYSLYLAKHLLSGQVIISYGDIVFRKHIMTNLLNDDGDIVIVVDAGRRDINSDEGRYADHVSCNVPYTSTYHEKQVVLESMGHALPANRVDGEWIGLMRLSPAGSHMVSSTLTAMAGVSGFESGRIQDLFGNLLANGTKIHVLYITGHWVDVDTLRDYSEALDL